MFRRDLGSLTDAYTEVAKRLGVIQSTKSQLTEPRLVKYDKMKARIRYVKMEF